MFGNKISIVGYGPNGIKVRISYFLNVLYLWVLITCHMDGNIHRNEMQMRLCIVKLGVVSSIYSDFWEESGWRCTYALGVCDIENT